MSMFDRNVKIQFNKMKYAPLVQKVLPNYYVTRVHVLIARGFFLLFGIAAASNLMNFDVFFYKIMLGVNRWRHRVENLILGHHHGYEYGLIGYADHSDGHGHGHDGENHSSHGNSRAHEE